MDFLTQRALKEIQFYLNECYGNVGICCNQAMPLEMLDKSPLTNFYYYENARPNSTLEQRFVRGDFYELPFITDSIDVFILWHNLDFHEAPQKLLKEIWRSLSPNGVLLIVGANSSYFFSPARTEKEKKLLIKRSAVAKLLTQQGFSIEVETTFGFHPRYSPRWLKQWLALLEVIGQFCFPMLGANFLFQARKSQLGLNFPLSAIKRKFLLSPKEIAEPTRRI